MESIVKTKDLFVIYNLGKSNEHQALKNIDIEIYPGEYVIFFGPSGCGKSTLLYTIAGLEFPSSGEVVVDNKDPTLLNSKQLVDYHRFTVGMVFQAYYLIPHISVLDNILLPQIFSGGEVEKRNKKAVELMQRFDILHLAKRKPSQLSGGQQQRVAIARALVNDPTIILADEPVGNLDSKNSDAVLQLLKDINRQEKKTIIHVTHNARDLEHADRIIYMKDGQIERVVNNKSPLSEQKITDLDLMAQSYPYLERNELLAKLILNQVTSDYSIETMQRMERTIAKFIAGKIKKQKLIELLDMPSERGGFSLYKQTAAKLTEQIARLSEEIEAMSKDSGDTEDMISKRAKSVREYLCEKYEPSISYEQIKELDQLLYERFSFKLSKPRLEQKLAKSIKEGGLGINNRTAKKFLREIELIMVEKKFKNETA